MQHPRQPHLDAILQISRYITKTVDYGILYTNNSSIRLAGFTDADYVGDVDTYRFIHWLFFLLEIWCSFLIQ